ncbi:alpha/beta hydrolase-fold protein [Singulisphaera acidiphila]|uniref:alpha/beta hydrolase-fold protein n=1 Tax=Singulisphaera acidiphila TaxID=466153 RepID=UPI0013773B94|nr:glycosyltransferase family 39 protein [Singulisphaera acidiphila]
MSRAGEFAHLNPKPFNLVLLARMIGFVWWLLGALIIFRWSDQLYGKKAGYFGVTLWSFCPIVLGYEQLATPELPSAVASLAAVYAFRGYLLLPTWNRTLVVGQLLGVALLTDFTSLALLVIFVFLSFVSQSRRADYRSLPFRLHNQVLHSVLSIGLALLVVNMGYGFNHSGSTLGTFGFPNRVPAGFHGTWLGRVIVPLPAEYVKGLVRRWHEWARPPLIDGEDKWPVEVGGRSPSTVGGDFPFSIQAILFGCLILAARRQPGSPPLAEALTLWVPLLTFLAMSTRMVAALPPASGTLLATPFAIIITSKITQCYSSRRQIVRWLAFGLSVWCLGDCVKSTHDRFFSPNRTTRFRQDLVRQGRKLGLAVPEPRTSVGSGSEERGLLYRTFTESEGDQVDYALYVPESYRGDRPFPLLLFLHGWGDRRNSPTDRMYAEVGLPFTLKYQSIDFLVLCPQGLSGSWQADGDDARRALELLAAVQKQYRVDPKRISLTGLSSGGSGAWDLAAQNPNVWAAIVPVASSCDPNQASLLKQTPCWCFHNRYDKSSPVQEPREMIERLRKLGGSPLFTEFSDTNHNAGERAFVLPELFDWLSRQRLP